jgi:arabinofuranosyltransferase
VLPNTALAKEANAVHWGRGWQYVLSTVNPYWLWVPLVLLGVFAYAPLLSRFARDQHGRGIAVVLAFVVGGLLDATYTIRVGGDYFHARLLLPALLAFCAPVAVIPLRRAAAGAALVLAWAITVGVSTTGPYSHFRSTYKIGMTANQRGWGRNGPARAWYTGPALYVQGIRLDDAPAANVKLPTGFQWGIGVSGYAMGTKFNVLDGFGLADPIDAHFHLDHAGFPGHEKPMPGAWAAARMTAPGSHVDAVQFPPPVLVPTMIPVATGAAFDRQVADARAALQCRPIVDLERSYTGHLTVRRFFSNMFHSVHNATFRIPPDPTEARAKLCHS